ncbi:MAG: hypothetical protein JWM59_1028 [Verrucomicrobiales bacterium]|nr:hypothetical protein [Verrucomicrobiales bacterium]
MNRMTFPVTELVPLVRRLLGRVEALEKDNASLREQLRAAKRPAAPFSKGLEPGTPKKPGRHPEKGRFERRGEPVPGPADRVEELRAPLDSPDCPRCGARLEVTEWVATVEDTPPEPVRIIRRFRVEHGACAVFGIRWHCAEP